MCKRKSLSAAWLATVLLCGGAARGVAQTRIDEEPWGRLPDGSEVTRYTLTNSDGARASFMPLGAAVLSLEAPDRDGRLTDLVLGFDSAAEYLTANAPYIGLTIGRYASRIAGTRITLDGETYELAAAPVGPTSTA
jgi:aldose 1-epimerase